MSGETPWLVYRVSFDYGVSAGPLSAEVEARNIAEAPLRVARMILENELRWPHPSKVKRVEVVPG